MCSHRRRKFASLRCHVITVQSIQSHGTSRSACGCGFSTLPPRVVVTCCYCCLSRPIPVAKLMCKLCSTYARPRPRFRYAARTRWNDRLRSAALAQPISPRLASAAFASRTAPAGPQAERSKAQGPREEAVTTSGATAPRPVLAWRVR
jgi:hypothetical protein